MREDFSKVCFETLLQFSFSNKVSTPQEGYISRMALSVLLKRSQDVLRRYVEDERLSGRCPLPRFAVLQKPDVHVCEFSQDHSSSAKASVFCLNSPATLGQFSQWH